MVAATLIRTARERSGFTLRALARRAGTSHSTLSAYESGVKVPTVDTLDRVLAAAGFSPEVTLAPRVRGRDATDRGAELEAVLELAEAFPARHAATMSFPRFPQPISDV